MKRPHCFSSLGSFELLKAPMCTEVNEYVVEFYKQNDV